MRRSVYIGLTVVTAIVGLASAWIPAPYDAVGLYVILIGLLILVLAGHRAAFRADGAGIFALWWKPVKMASEQVHESDQWPLFLGLVAALSPILSMIFRIWIA